MKEIIRKMNTNNFHRFTKITQYKIIIIKYLFLMCSVFCCVQSFGQDLISESDLIQ